MTGYLFSPAIDFYVSLGAAIGLPLLFALTLILFPPRGGRS